MWFLFGEVSSFSLCLGWAAFFILALPGTMTKLNVVGKYQLYYFAVRGRAQAIQYLFIDNDIDYEWIKPPLPNQEEWLIKYKPMMIFGQCPMLVDGDFQLSQSHAILRYLGRKHGLNAETLQDKARMDMVMDYVQDVRLAYYDLITTNFEAGKEDFIKTLQDKFRRLTVTSLYRYRKLENKLLSKLYQINSVHWRHNVLKKWGNEHILFKMTMVDYNLFDILDDLLVLSSDCLKEFPLLQAFHTRMANRPKLKAYRDTEEFKKTPLNGNGKQ